MLVEFIGLSGLGKSTVASELAKALGESIYPVHFVKVQLPFSLWEKCGVFVYSLRAPVKLIKELACVRSLRGLIGLVSYYRRKRLRDKVRCLDGIVVMDEGLLKGIVMAVAVNSERIIDMRARVPEPDLLVVVQGDPRTAHLRGVERYFSSGEAMHPTPKTLGFLQELESHQENLLARLNGARILIDAELDPKQNARILASHILNFHVASAWSKSDH